MSIFNLAKKIRHNYYNYNIKKERLQKLQDPKNKVFASLIATQEESVNGYLSGNNTASDDFRLERAINWILKAQASTSDGGVSLGYFPLSTENGWRKSYPETTGYIITTLLRYAQTYNRPEIKTAAIVMGDWEIDVQMDSGAVQGGPLCPKSQQTAAAFNTGMVLDGWCSLFEETQDEKYVAPLKRAALFLLNDLDESGFFKTNGSFVSQGEVKTYTCLCAWSMYRAGVLLGRNDLQMAAIRSVEAALKKQTANGWFASNCLTESHRPLTHTIGYVIQGIFEVGVLSGREDFLNAARLALSSAVKCQQEKGFLAGRLNHFWEPTCDWVCLTGSAQLAIVCYRFAEQLGDFDLVPFANNLIDFVKATQVLESEDPNIVGGISGSYPIPGEYMQDGYPNWATKYFIDAVMLQNKIQ